jgi:hypothetical protein
MCGCPERAPIYGEFSLRPLKFDTSAKPQSSAMSSERSPAEELFECRCRDLRIYDVPLPIQGQLPSHRLQRESAV